MNPQDDGVSYAPSEEFVLHCDVQGCPAALAMISGVSRDQHGWGRCSLYEANYMRDYDLCAQHWDEIRAVLGGQR